MARHSTRPSAVVVVKDFSKLNALIPGEQQRCWEQKTESLSSSQAIFQFDGDDDITDVVWGLMSDRKGRTVSDVMLLLNEVPQFDARDVEQALAYFHMKGCMIKTNQHIPIYTLKGNAMQPNESKTKVKDVEKKDATSLGLKVEPTLIEKIDIALWNLMSDSKWRTVNDMCKAIVNETITRQKSRTRLETHYRGNWFERRGDGDNTKYRMRGNVAYPQPKSLGAASAPLADNVAEFSQEDVMTPEPIIDNVAPAAPKAPVTTSASVRVPDVVVKIEDPTMEDGLSTSIWKVMADHKEYTAHEIAALLEHVGVPYTAVANRLSALFLHSHWFTRRHVGEGRARCFTYRLKDSILCPKGETVYDSPARRELKRVAALKAKAEARVGVREHMKPVDNTPPAMELALVNAGLVPTEERPTILGPTTKAAIAAVVQKTVEIPAPVDPVDSQKEADGLADKMIMDALKDLDVVLVSSLPQLGALKPNTGLESTAKIIGARMATQGIVNSRTVGVDSKPRVVGGVPVRADFGDVLKPTELHNVRQQIKASAIEAFEVTAKEPYTSVIQPKEDKQMATDSTAPIVQIKVDIKGIPFTLLEAEQLMPEIVRLGYSTPATIKDHSSSLIQTNTTIKGYSFTPTELCDVFRGLKEAGIGKQVK